MFVTFGRAWELSLLRVKRVCVFVTFGRAWELSLLRVKRVCMFVTFGRAWELSLLMVREARFSSFRSAGVSTPAFVRGKNVDIFLFGKSNVVRTKYK